METCTFQPKVKKIKKIHPEKIYIFSDKSFSYILENGNPEKFFHT